VQVLPGEFGLAEGRVSGERLLGLPVRAPGLRLGRSVDLLVDPKRGHVLGLDVLGRQERRRFLPFSTATLAGDALLVPSALVLIDEEDASFYRSRALPLSQLQGLPVERDGHSAGVLRDLVVEADGRISALVVELDSMRLELPCGESLQLGRSSLRC
jgi:hypothetical protein